MEKSLFCIDIISIFASEIRGYHKEHRRLFKPPLTPPNLGGERERESATRCSWSSKSDTMKNIFSMAKIIYEVYQNQNEHNAAYGKWYGRVKYLESLNTRKLSNHIAEHGSIYTPDIVYGVMEKFRSCLLEMLLNSKKVKIEGLGTFYTTIECAKGGAVSKDKFNIQKDVKGLHIRFLPEQEQEQNISSREFLKQAEFINIDSFLKKEEESSAEGGENQGGTQGGGTNGGTNTGGTNTGGDNGGGNNGGGDNGEGLDMG